MFIYVSFEYKNESFSKRKNSFFSQSILLSHGKALVHEQTKVLAHCR